MTLSGRLFDISPLGTGFIETAENRVFGFHFSMLPDLGTPAGKHDWPAELEGKPVSVVMLGSEIQSVHLASATSPSGHGAC